MTKLLAALALLCVLFVSDDASAWGAKGHGYVGAIADKLLANTNAGAEVRRILGYDLKTAAKWADCIKSVKKVGRKFVYTEDPQHPEYTAPCTAFETPAEKARMQSFVRRNWGNCVFAPGKGCHESYHFADVAVQRDHYDRAFAGTNDHDVVSAINAAIDVLEGKPAPKPFSIKDKKEAILLIAHFVGDMHQPLHVGSVYLDESGAQIDPDAPGADVHGTETQGGNSIVAGTRNLHSQWDAIPDSLGSTPSEDVVNDAEAVPATSGPIEQLASTWASDSVIVSHTALSGMTFAGSGAHRWKATFDDASAYAAMKEDLQTKQVEKAGARLAELFKRVWP